MRIFISGQKSFGGAIFKLVQDLGHEIVGVSAPYISEGSGRPDRLWAAAEMANLAHRIKAGELRSWHIPEDTDLIIAAHSHDFLGVKIRRKARLGAIGYHPSLLPYHRGRDAIRWTIHMGDRITGGTVFWLTSRVDAGPIAAQEHVFISPKETVCTLWREKLFPLGVTLFRKVLEDLAKGIVVKIPQPKEIGGYEPSWEREPLPRHPEPFLIGGGSEFETIVERDYQKACLYM